MRAKSLAVLVAVCAAWACDDGDSGAGGGGGSIDGTGGGGQGGAGAQGGAGGEGGIIPSGGSGGAGAEGGSGGSGAQGGSGGSGAQGGAGGAPACAEGDEEACDVGDCSGTRRCADGAWTPCAGPDEICNDADDDCDGTADEGVPGLGEPCSAGTGACETAGVTGCNAAGDGVECAAVPGEPGVELCGNEVDEDCDGQLDNGFDGLGDPCVAGEGACAAEGTLVCDPAGDGVVCDAAPDVPGVEQCGNLVDEDCDGALDNGFEAIGEACTAGEGACAAGGSLRCNAAGDGVACDATPRDGSDERCGNAVDEDCDGQTDEAFPELGADCSIGEGACAADGQWVCGPGGASAVCAATPGAPDLETCNGVDDDCDGTIDEDADAECYPGPDGTEGRGVCRAGLSRCVDGVLTACEGAVTPGDEICNGDDDDCDGRADEAGGGIPLSEACYDGPEGTADVGLCTTGRRTCAVGVFGPCLGEVTPRDEVCDGQDNDCNGEIDEVGGGCACLPGVVEECYSGDAPTLGVGVCRGSQHICPADGSGFGPCLGEIIPSVERCDGRDNDCDGSVDEALPGVGAACADGVGECRRPGVTVCDGEAGLLRCDAVVAAPEAERCDRRDNDCDGAVDEELGVGEPCADGEGACLARGQVVCDGAGGVRCSAEPGEPSPEFCDDEDNDCDGSVDEELGLGDACDEGIGACQRPGVRVCDRGAVICDAEPGAPQAEACDGADNDCDGRPDEENPGGGNDCNTGVPGVCAAGRTVCRNAAFECEQIARAAAEVCDGLDNDCDGARDEDDGGNPLAARCYDGAPPTDGVGPCRAGLRTCEGGQLGACVGQVLPRAEVCNQQDDDCNGPVDDLAAGRCVCQPGEARDCYEGPEGTQGVGLCVRGRQRCLADGSGFAICEGQVLPQAEACDGADNDCNGRVDDAQGVGVACFAGSGECRADGRIACDVANRRLVCDAVPGAPRAELCDGRDNDCNDAVDDVAGLGDACTSGLGECSRPGNAVCDLRRGALVCNAVPGDATAERCDARDNDCDGDTDEDFGARCAAFPIVVIDGGGFRWDVGSRGEILDGTRDAYDNGLSLAGFPAQARALADLPADGSAGGTVALGPAAIVGLQVSRRIVVSGNDAHARFQEVLENPGGEPVEIRVSVATNLGSDGNTRIVATSSGDLALDVNDDWIVTDDGTNGVGDSVVLHVFSGSGGVIQPAAASLVRDGLTVEFVVNVPAGGSVSLLHFASQNLNLDAALARANGLRSAGDAAASELPDRVLNFGIPEGSLRLVGDANPRAGRVEVFVQGRWGTVCDDSWEAGNPIGRRNGDVVCRQLGFRGAAQVDHLALPGVDPIWLDEVQCVGAEARVVDCPHSPVGVHNCVHVEDVSVRCLNDGECVDDAHCGAGQRCVQARCVAPEVCDDRVDNDGDNLTDCADDECAGHPTCDPCNSLQCGDVALCVNGRCVLDATLMRCGSSQRNVADFVDVADGLTVVADCVPNVRTQALLVTRQGAGLFDPAVVRAYAQAGGRVITEAFSSDEVYNAVLQRNVASGAFSGAPCLDRINPVVRLTAADRFWVDNPNVPLAAANEAGCGNNLAAFPDLVQLGGRNANLVQLGYVRPGVGRAWLVDYDWQDTETQGAAFAPSRTLMRYMMFNGGIPAARPIAAPGASIQFTGSIDTSDPTWARPGAACGAGAAPKFWDAFKIMNLTGVARTVTVSAAWRAQAPNDGYLHAWREPFDPAVLAGCIVGNDDFGGVAGSRIANLALAPGQVVVVVASTFASNAAIGPYTITVQTQ